ncbi:hypothetical protein N8855_00890 [bacterium]|nr:hypothetical protein [bacterium]
MTTMQVTLIASRSNVENEKQIFTDSILETFGTVDNAKDAYKDYHHVSRGMSEAHNVTFTVSQIENYQRWSDAKKNAETKAFADWTETNGEYFSVEFHD